jgi:polyketide synthase 12
VSLAGCLRAYGVRPAAVVGHSQGELAAACVAGVLSLADAGRIVALRSGLIATELAGHGGMVSVALPVAEAEALLSPWGERVGVAAVNGPRATVVAGEPAALDELVAVAERDGVRARRIPVDYASHTRQVERIQDALLALARPVVARPGEVPMYSSVTGGLLDPTTVDAEYWYRNLRGTVRFEQATRALADAGHDVFVEVSPRPVLTAAVAETVADDGIAVTGVLRRDDGGLDRLLAAVAELFVAGVAVDWSAATAGGRLVDLPTYPFRGRRYWLDAPDPGSSDVDDRFWAAVRQADPDELAATLGVGDRDVRASLSTVLPALSAWHQQNRETAVVDGWRYRVDWTPVPDDPAARLTGTWLLVAPDRLADDPRTHRVAAALRRRGAHVVISDEIACRPGVAGVLSLAGWDERPHPSSPVVPRGLADTVALASEVTAPLWCVTSGAVRTGTGDDPISPAAAMVWGLGRVVAQEYPDDWGGLVDLPAEPDDAALDRLCGLLAGGSGEDQLAVRTSGTFARRLARHPVRRSAVWRPTGTTLVTGGTGALGGHIARWLAARGAPHLLLLSRRGPAADGAEELRAELAAAGTQVTVLACDVADRAALADALASIPAEFPLTAVVHAAAALDDGPLPALTVSRMDTALRAKAGAAWHLHELTAHLDLTAFVLCSSTAGVFGAAGQGNYAPGNAFLDAFAEYRRAAGKVATSIAWGAWAQGGMAEQDAVVDLRRRHGVPAMPPQRAALALERALAADDTCLVVADIDWERFHLAYTAARPSPFLNGLREQPPGPERPPAPGPALAQRLAGLGRPEQDRVLRDLVRSHAAAVLGHDSPAGVPQNRAFWELGLDSVTAVELRNRLATAAGVRLPAGVIFDHPTVRGLAGHLRDQLCGDEAPVDPVLSELDRLELALAAMPDDSPVRPDVADRLGRLARRMTVATDWDLAGASPDEVFALIDDELGAP